MTSAARKPKAGECHVCIQKGMPPSEAVACCLHSTLIIEELRAEIAVLKDTASASSRLHLALADMNSAVPSVDGSEELRSVVEDRARLDRVLALAEHLVLVAGCDDEAAEALVPRCFPKQRKKR